MIEPQEAFRLMREWRGKRVKAKYAHGGDCIAVVYGFNLRDDDNMPIAVLHPVEVPEDMAWINGRAVWWQPADTLEAA